MTDATTPQAITTEARTTEAVRIEGRAAALPIENLDTDQIMPKQFLRGIDKAGLAQGVLHDLRFDSRGAVRADFVLNRPEFSDTSILVGGSNFGCGSSREHAVWGLQQLGIRAVIAPSFAEIFYSNAMNNRLLLVTLPVDQIARLMVDAGDPSNNAIHIDIAEQSLQSRSVNSGFELMPRHRRMFLEGLDNIGLSLTCRDQIAAFAQRHWTNQPWLRDVAALTQARLHEQGGDSKVDRAESIEQG